MTSNRTRRWFLRGSAVTGAVALAGCIGDDDDEPADDGTGDGTGDDEPADDGTGNGGDDDDQGDDEPADDGTGDDEDDDDQDDEEGAQSYEIWAADQGRNEVHIYEPGEEDGEFVAIDTIDTGAVGGETPHMIDYTTDYEYAAIACTAGGRVLVYRTEDRELVGNIETGPGSHFASFSPDDEYLTVDVIGEERIAKVEANFETGEFAEVDEIVTDASIEGLTDEEGAPVCHQFDGNNNSIHTLGPSYHDAGLLVVDHDDFSVHTALPGDELPTNCGTVPHPTEDKFYLTAGLPTPTDEDGQPLEGEDGVGDYYVLDTADGSYEVIESGQTGGVDAHGFWFTPDAEELWILNRETNDGVVLDPDTDDVIDEIDEFGPATSEDSADRDSPDIMWASPDGEYLFVTLRGPDPKSGDPHAATGVNPGFAVLDIDSRERIETVQPTAVDADGATPDFHGIGVRPIGDWDGYTSPPY